MDEWTYLLEDVEDTGGISLDDILNEYCETESSETEYVTDVQTELLAASEPENDIPAKPVETQEDAVSAPKSRRESMAEEAKGLFARLSAEDYESYLKEEQAAAERDRDVEIDPRFNLGGKHRRRTMYFDGREIDMSSEPGYEQKDQGFAIPSTYATEGDGEYFVEEKSGLGKLFKGKKHFSGIFSSEEPAPERRQAAQPEPPENDAADAPDDGGTATPAVPHKLSKTEKKKKKSAFSHSDAPKQREEMPDTQPDDAEEYGFSDLDADSYAENLDYDEDFVEDGKNESYRGSSANRMGEFPSFREFMKAEITGLLLRLRGYGSSTTATVDEKEENLGEEVNAKTASRYYGSFARSQRLRIRIGVILLVIMIWLSMGLPSPGMLKDTRVASAMLLACQLNIMLLALDVLTGALINIKRMKFGADVLVLFSCLLTSLDALLVAGTSVGTVHIPLCVLSSLSLLGLLISSYISSQAMRKAIRVPAIGKRIYTVTGETNVKGSDVTLLKSMRPYKGFVRRCEEAPPDETLFNKLSPFIAAVALLFAVIVALAKKHGSDILYIYSAILAPAVPVGALMSFAMPFFIGSNRIFSSGAAIAGWSGLCDIGTSRNIIVTDRDIFPEGSVELDSIRIYTDESSEKVIAYAGTMLTAAGSGVSGCFGEIMEKYGCRMRQIENFEYLPGGGMKGIIEGDTVLCGSTELMRLMNVPLPYRLVGKTSVLLAVDGKLYGIFNMKYTGKNDVREALTNLMRSNRHPIFSIRDFNVTPDMIHTTFDVATDGYDFPPYVERFKISSAAPTDYSKVAAVVCREGLGPLTHMADTGRSIYLAVRINLLLSVLSVVLALFTVLFKLLSAGSVGIGFLLLYMLFWAIPTVLVSFFLHT